jgi:hypothetical protein
MAIDGFVHMICSATCCAVQPMRKSTCGRIVSMVIASLGFQPNYCGKGT